MVYFQGYYIGSLGLVWYSSHSGIVDMISGYIGCMGPMYTYYIGHHYGADLTGR